MCRVLQHQCLDHSGRIHGTISHNYDCRTIIQEMKHWIITVIKPRKLYLRYIYIFKTGNQEMMKMTPCYITVQGGYQGRMNMTP